MGNRTDRFGFVTFDNDSDDLAFHNHQAFVADRISMDRLLRIACEAHTHTGIVLSEIPPPAPELQVSRTGGCLPPNESVHYKVAIVDIYGQERLASASASAFTPPQVATPGTPKLTADSYGSLPPGDYQYAVSAYVDAADNETAMSNIVTGSLVAPKAAWIIAPPPPPSGADGWNLYRKAPTEIGFRRLMTEEQGSGGFNFYDDGLELRGFERSPDENTTNVTSSVTVDLVEPLSPGQSAKIYRTFDSGDWETSLVAWTPTVPYVDQGFPTGAGYPPDVSAGVGGAPKIRLGTDTTGALPPGLLTPTYTAMFNIRGQVQVGYWRWQWINEFDEFRLLRMRANLGRGSWADAAPVKIALDVRRNWDHEHWERFTQYDQPLLLQIPQLANGGTLVFPDNTMPDLRLYPGDGLRVAIMQSGGGFGTDHDLTISIVGAVRHGPKDSSGSLTPTHDLAFLIPGGASADASSEYIDVLDTQTGIATIAWAGMPASANGFEIQDEANNTTYSFTPETADGSTAAPSEWPRISGPTRLRIKTFDGVGSDAQITLSLLGKGEDVASNVPWVVRYSYDLTTGWVLFEHSPDHLLETSSNVRARLKVPAQAILTAITLEKDVESGYRARIGVEYEEYIRVFCLNTVIDFTGADPTISTGPPASGPMLAGPTIDFTIDMYETTTGEYIYPAASPQLRVTLHFEESLSPPPADWTGMPGHPPLWEDHPI